MCLKSLCIKRFSDFSIKKLWIAQLKSCSCEFLQWTYKTQKVWDIMTFRISCHEVKCGLVNAISWNSNIASEWGRENSLRWLWTWHGTHNHFYSLQREVQKLNIPLASVSLVKCLLQISSSFQVWSFKARQVYLAYSLFQTEAVQGTLRKYSTKYKSTRYKEQWIENEMTLKQLLRRKMIIMTINKIIEK